MPDLNEENVRHLLRRTEVVDRPERVAELLALGSISQAVDDVMAIDANPPSASFSGVDADSNWRLGIRLSEHWMDQMASAARPFGERMAFFWHGHICSELGKVGSAIEMRRQIDLFRSTGVNGNISTLMKTMAIQVAMLKYLDNDQNRASSPNQNFARELMELFLLGVGNYTEADVEAATAAWTGHGRPRWDVDTYRFDPDQHENAPQQFLGRTVNNGSPAQGGNQTIDVILGNGIVPAGAEINRGAATRDVAADFLSKKLWQEFGEAASRGVPSGVAGAMRSALVGSNFGIRPWVAAMLNHDDFYSAATKGGLVRQPIDYVVALLVATGLRAEDGAQTWLMERTGQRPLYPPNVSGWKPNGYWVNASAMGARQEMANGLQWRLQRDTWEGENGYMDIGRDSVRITKTEVNGLWKNGTYTEPMPRDQLVDRLTLGLQLNVTSDVRTRILDHLAYLDSRPVDDVGPWQRLDALFLLLSAPEMHIA
ncbi:MAG: DUF1800 family protein [Ilumatobacter sp.]|uniref:DUF1800 family protein n=1 Tax=Ilumatobacter sp. TaxID=1967498 RepID=UPI003C75AECD